MTQSEKQIAAEQGVVNAKLDQQREIANATNRVRSDEMKYQESKAENKTKQSPDYLEQIAQMNARAKQIEIQKQQQDIENKAIEHKNQSLAEYNAINNGHGDQLDSNYGAQLQSNNGGWDITDNESNSASGANWGITNDDSNSSNSSNANAELGPDGWPLSEKVSNENLTIPRSQEQLANDHRRRDQIISQMQQSQQIDYVIEEESDNEQ